MNEANIPRRDFLAAGTTMLTACSSVNAQYFGSTAPPSSATQVHSLLAEANAETLWEERMRKLAECEGHLLRQMPILPLYYNVFASLRKPYVRGFDPGRPGLVRFKSVWLDTNWRPQ